MDGLTVLVSTGEGVWRSTRLHSRSCQWSQAQRPSALGSGVGTGLVLRYFTTLEENLLGSAEFFKFLTTLPAAQKMLQTDTSKVNRGPMNRNISCKLRQLLICDVDHQGLILASFMIFSWGRNVYLFSHGEETYICLYLCVFSCVTLFAGESVADHIDFQSTLFCSET
jgi:hypothetical protein